MNYILHTVIKMGLFHLLKRQFHIFVRKIIAISFLASSPTTVASPDTRGIKGSDWEGDTNKPGVQGGGPQGCGDTREKNF